jgi:hypothetical protein
MGFEPTIQAFKREKTVHALDRAVTVIGRLPNCSANSVVQLKHLH